MTETDDTNPIQVDLVALESLIHTPEVESIWQVEMWDKRDDHAFMSVTGERPLLALHRFLMIIDLLEQFVDLIKEHTPDTPLHMPCPATGCTLHLTENPDRMFGRWNLVIRNKQNAVILDKWAMELYLLEDSLREIVEAGQTALWEMEKRLTT